VPFLAAHVVLGLVIRFAPAFATMHAAMCVAAGLVIAAVRPPREVAYVIAYIAGAEVLWRMAHADVFHEGAKYAVSAVILIAMIRMRTRRNRLIAIGYFALLVPSALITWFAPDIDGRGEISFNLSGPLSITLCVMFFSNLRFTAAEARRMFFALIGPLLAISAFVYISMGRVEQLVFKSDSMHATSGGFGPNQVSAVLGLGVLFALLTLLDRKLRWRMRSLLIALLLLFAVQAALTFSRGGIIMALASTFAAMTYLIRDQRRRITLVVVCGLGFLVANYIIIPQIETFTGGALADRYTDTTSTGRVKIAGFDLQIFEDHPLFGVGPGMANPIRKEMGRLAAAHTEYTRMLAEHGLLGAAALLLLVVLGWRTFRGARTLEARAMVVAMLSWTALFLAIDGTRLVAPALTFGLACAFSYSSLPPKQPQRR
jgi:O-antigen ligase